MEGGSLPGTVQQYMDDQGGINEVNATPALESTAPSLKHRLSRFGPSPGLLSARPSDLVGGSANGSPLGSLIGIPVPDDDIAEENEALGRWLDENKEEAEELAKGGMMMSMRKMATSKYNLLKKAGSKLNVGSSLHLMNRRDSSSNNVVEEQQSASRAPSTATPPPGRRSSLPSHLKALIPGTFMKKEKETRGNPSRHLRNRGKKEKSDKDSDTFFRGKNLERHKVTVFGRFKLWGRFISKDTERSFKRFSSTYTLHPPWSYLPMGIFTSLTVAIFQEDILQEPHLYIVSGLGLLIIFLCQYRREFFLKYLSGLLSYFFLIVYWFSWLQFVSDTAGADGEKGVRGPREKHEVAVALLSYSFFPFCSLILVMDMDTAAQLALFNLLTQIYHAFDFTTNQIDLEAISYYLLSTAIINLCPQYAVNKIMQNMFAEVSE